MNQVYVEKILFREKNQNKMKLSVFRHTVTSVPGIGMVIC